MLGPALSEETFQGVRIAQPVYFDQQSGFEIEEGEEAFVQGLKPLERVA